MKTKTKILGNRLRGQTKVESAFALALLVIAGIGAWKLYGDPIRITTREMIEYYFPADPEPRPQTPAEVSPASAASSVGLTSSGSPASARSDLEGR